MIFMLKYKQKQEIADIVGEDFFSTEDYMNKLYSHDISSLPGIVNDLLYMESDGVAQPTSSEIVSNLIKYCLENKIPMVPRGHGTSGYGGALPTVGGLCVEMTRMNEIYNIDQDEMTIEVGAGIIWGRLLENLEAQGLTLRAYPSSAPSSTVGGWVAAGGTGIGSTKYGGVEKQVVDLEVVLPDGTIMRTSEAPKGLMDSLIKEDYTFFPGADTYYWEPEIDETCDMTELILDSNGALGIITKVVLKVIPLQTFKPLSASFQDKESMLSACMHLKETTDPFYLHFVTDMFYGMLDELGLAPETSGPWVISCTYEGPESQIAKDVESFNKIVQRHGGTVESEEIANHEWSERFYPMRVKRLGPSVAPSEVYVPLDHMDLFLEQTAKHFKGERFAAEGAVNEDKQVAVLCWFLDDERKKISFLMGWYRSLDFIDIGLKNGGKPYSIGMWNVAHSRNYYGEDRYGQMSELKKKTDPKGKLNPHAVFPGPMRLSLRMNLLILLAGAVAAPIALWVAGLIVPTILQGFVPWLMIDDLWSIFQAVVLGLIAATAVVEVANYVPMPFALTMGGPFMRLFRKIFH